MFIVISSLTLKLVSKVDANVVKYIYAEHESLAMSDEAKQVKARVITLISWIPVIMFLSTFSLLNFPFCLLASIVIGLITLVFRPTHKSRRKDFVCGFGLLLVSLPALHYYSSVYLPYSSETFYWFFFLYHRYSSLMFPFFTLIYFPHTLSLFSLAVWDL